MGIIPKPLAEANLIGPSNGEELIMPGISKRLVEMINSAILGKLEHTLETDWTL